MKCELRQLSKCIGVVVVLLTSCNVNSSDVTQANPAQEQIGINAKVSDCGGFEENAGTRSTAQISEYCRDEQLVWQYQQQSGTLSLSNQNVWLNCCGEHAVSISINHDTQEYEMRETDAPQSSGGRCLCMCFFDFNIDVPNLADQVFPLKLFRHVIDAGSEQMIWNGTLDLQAGSGIIVIQKNIGYCQ